MQQFAESVRVDFTGTQFLQFLDHAKNVGQDAILAISLDAEIVGQGSTCPVETASNVILHV